ncbi:AAA family ATPase [Phenylobacterium sp. J426]|uniref:AAA family ATPase n=1 Tax=Phenylobacterium sp. J426 TaxID=2898439 RepID=UPI0021509C1C|nr:AAA family ATPase [Phenylobacterium sp. J426]MCR5875145.1 AAA family ATPase [Phenylobacterium sp. J426]
MSAVPANDDIFSRHMEVVAKKLLGDPNKALSSPAELRFGSHGSLAVDLEMGVWSDHEAKEGGGVIDLVMRERRCSKGEALDWLRQETDVELQERQEPQRSTGNVQPLKRIVATYDYVDEAGKLIFQTVRYEPKDFRQRRPDPSARDGWAWSVKGVRQVPYRLPEIREAIGAGAVIFVTEGEKDADALQREGLVATCNAMGAGKWPEELVEHFVGADVVILPDNDDAGRNHAAVVGAALAGKAKRIRVLDLPNLPPKGDVSDWLNEGGEAVELLAAVERLGRTWQAERPQSRFRAIPWADIDNVVTRRNWLVEDMIFENDSGLMYGASQSGKSFLMTDMSFAIARGVPFLGKPTRKGAVIYQAGEGGLGLLSRMKAYRKHYDLGADELPFVLLPGKVDLYSRESSDTDDLIAEILAWGAYLSDPLALVVIDTFSTASPGANENASEDMSRVLMNLERIQREAGCAVMAVHHKNASGEKPRGHTSLYANADTALEVIRDEVTNVRTLRVAKVKDGEDGEKISFRLQSVDLGSYESGKPITSCVVAPAEDGDRRTGPNRKPLTTDQRMFLTALDAAIRMHGGVMPAIVQGARAPTPAAWSGTTS